MYSIIQYIHVRTSEHTWSEHCKYGYLTKIALRSRVPPRMSPLLNEYVLSISAETSWMLPRPLLVLVYSDERTCICLFIDVSSSPGGVGGSSYKVLTLAYASLAPLFSSPNSG